MTVSKESIVTEARSWLGTPFHHQARVKGVGVDCVGLVIGVARNLGLVDPNFDVNCYPRVPDGTSFLQLIAQNLREVPFEDAQLGDVCCIAIESDPQHVGIVGDYPGGRCSLIHSSSGSGKVVEQRLVFLSTIKLVGMFRYHGV